MKIFENKRIVITGGTGSLGKTLVKRLLSGKNGTPQKIIVFSRDEAKQHFMRMQYMQTPNRTDETIYNNFKRLLEFRIGDIRNYSSVLNVLKDADIVINAAALKQVPSCEYFPYEAVQTNINGADNIVKAIGEHNLKVETVVGVSTDKACKPVNVMGMSKAMMERIFISANLFSTSTRFICVRYGNVLASRGSVIPLFHEQIKNGGPLTITSEDMTRFLLPLEHAVDTIIFAISNGQKGETIIPKIPSTNILNVAKALIGERKIKIEITGIRPGEKMDELMVSDEEAWHTYDLGNYLAISPMLPELTTLRETKSVLKKEYNSANNVLSFRETYELLKENNLLINSETENDEFLR